MAYRNLTQKSMMLFAKAARDHGWTSEETLAVVRAAQQEINRIVLKGRRCSVKDVLRKHATALMQERRMLNQAMKED